MQEYLTNIDDLSHILQWGGFSLFLLFIYVETAFPPIGVFLPNDFILFSAGMFAGSTNFPFSVFTIFISTIVIALLGDYTSYILGNKFEEKVKAKGRWLFINKDVLDRLDKTLSKYGQARILTIGRFLPYIRSFIPFFAGATTISLRTFTRFNTLGVLIWACAFLGAGHLLGRTFPEIINYLEWILITIALVGLIPLFLNKKK